MSALRGIGKSMGYTVFALGGLIVAMFAVLVVAAAVDAILTRQMFNTDDQDYQWIKTELDRLSPPRGAVEIDFTRVNGGNWKAVCVFGSYSRPLEEISNLGGQITTADRIRLSVGTQPGLFPRLGPVEAGEVVVAYIQSDMTARFIDLNAHVRGAQHLKRCIVRPSTRMTL
ncbi:MAG: hypothetical protein AAGC70_08405 [Pseudomonadota bacterium]